MDKNETNRDYKMYSDGWDDCNKEWREKIRGVVDEIEKCGNESPCQHEGWARYDSADRLGSLLGKDYKRILPKDPPKGNKDG